LEFVLFRYEATRGFDGVVQIAFVSLSISDISSAASPRIRKKRWSSRSRRYTILIASLLSVVNCCEMAGEFFFKSLRAFLSPSMATPSVSNCKRLEHFCGGIKLNHELVGCLGQEELVLCEASEGCFLQILLPEDSECLVVFLGPIMDREAFFWREHEEGEPARG
jgi:hypothetical protein